MHSVCLYISLVISDYMVFGFNKDIRIRIRIRIPINEMLDNYSCECHLVICRSLFVLCYVLLFKAVNLYLLLPYC